MDWELNSDSPIYLQLMGYIERRIISGEYKAGDKIPSVRELAAEAKVNPNTMQKALAELERGGLIYVNRTSGRYITEDAEMIQRTKRDMAKSELTAFLEKMKQLGYEKKEILELLVQETNE